MMNFVVLAVLVVGGKTPFAASELYTDLQDLVHVYCTATIDNIISLSLLHKM